jgi:hypothetical protein
MRNFVIFLLIVLGIRVGVRAFFYPSVKRQLRYANIELQNIKREREQLEKQIDTLESKNRELEFSVQSSRSREAAMAWMASAEASAEKKKAICLLQILNFVSESQQNNKVEQISLNKAQSSCKNSGINLMTTSVSPNTVQLRLE